MKFMVVVGFLMGFLALAVAVWSDISWLFFQDNKSEQKTQWAYPAFGNIAESNQPTRTVVLGFRDDGVVVWKAE